MNRYICIHGHFYQPPRENPWLEEIELQDSAYPYHDWNDRIAAESYAPNTASRILDGEKRIIDIVNNYSRMSFNFGPTLLFWMERHRPDIYQAILDADKQGMERFGGHGPAIAQAYNHMIMPLANSRDKLTQIIWGIRDFEVRFGRKPEGMWLPETGVDYESLDMMASMGIKFTILAPRQTSKVRKIGEKKWHDVSGSRVDPKRPYICRLPSKRSIALFFYDGPISQEIGFGNLLSSGENLASRLMSAFTESTGEQLVHIATDGETYGHHHMFGDMALAYCLYHIETNELAKVTIYGEHLETYPPEWEARIFENSSWSCIHGVERWRSNCGCNTGGRGEWNQEWRGPLRGALDWLRDNAIELYEEHSKGLIRDPWAARDEYIDVILCRDQNNVEGFLKKNSAKAMNAEAKVKALSLLEMQRNALLMYTSCAWFFDEVSGIENVQVMRYAARVIQLADQITGIKLEETFISLLQKASSNVQEIGDAAEAYRQYVLPSILDLRRVAVHYGVSSLFRDYRDENEIYAFHVKDLLHAKFRAGNQSMAIGRVSLRSKVTWQEQDISYAVLHLGDHNIIGGARVFRGDEAFEEMVNTLKESFSRSDTTTAIRAIDSYFSDHSISIWNLFHDEQQRVFKEILKTSQANMEAMLRQMHGSLLPLMQALRAGNIPTPRYFIMVMEFLLESDFRRALERDELDLVELERLGESARQWPLDIDRAMLGLMASNHINRLIEQWAADPADSLPLEKATKIIALCQSLGFELDLWKAQTLYFIKGREYLSEFQKYADEGQQRARKWIEAFRALGEQQGVKIENVHTKSDIPHSVHS